jgi:hypothetical protein
LVQTLHFGLSTGNKNAVSNSRSTGSAGSRGTRANAIPPKINFPVAQHPYGRTCVNNSSHLHLVLNDIIAEAGTGSARRDDYWKIISGDHGTRGVFWIYFPLINNNRRWRNNRPRREKHCSCLFPMTLVTRLLCPDDPVECQQTTSPQGCKRTSPCSVSVFTCVYTIT